MKDGKGREEGVQSAYALKLKIQNFSMLHVLLKIKTEAVELNRVACLWWLSMCLS